MIAIFGAGAVGCWIGGRLSAGGADVTLIGRAHVIDELAGGLEVTEVGGRRDAKVTPALTTTDPAAAADADVVLVTVKSPQTGEAGAALASVLAEGTVVVSMQNGVRNADVLRGALPGRRVLAAMVPFNVVRRGPGAYHRGSDGVLRIDDDPGAAPFLAACQAAGVPIESRRDMPAVQWTKLVMNLNSAINTLSGQPIADELRQRAFRVCVAAAQREAFDLLAEAKQDVARLTPIPPRWMPRLLALPDSVFRLVAPRVIAVAGGPTARSSMWPDFEARRPTEVDYLQGEVVELAERLGKDAPVNRVLLQLMHEAEAGGRREFTGDALRAALGLS